MPQAGWDNISFYNQHKYCLVVNSTTVDYSAFWHNCNCGFARSGVQTWLVASSKVCPWGGHLWLSHTQGFEIETWVILFWSVWECKLAYLSFHNLHKYCLIVNSTTVDYSAFWYNCNCGGQSLHTYIYIANTIRNQKPICKDAVLKVQQGILHIEEFTIVKVSNNNLSLLLTIINCCYEYNSVQPSTWLKSCDIHTHDSITPRSKAFLI